MLIFSHYRVHESHFWLFTSQLEVNVSKALSSGINVTMRGKASSSLLWWSLTVRETRSPKQRRKQRQSLFFCLQRKCLHLLALITHFCLFPQKTHQQPHTWTWTLFCSIAIVCVRALWIVSPGSTHVHFLCVSLQTLYSTHFPIKTTVWTLLKAGVQQACAEEKKKPHVCRKP